MANRFRFEKLIQRTKTLDLMKKLGFRIRYSIDKVFSSASYGNESDPIFIVVSFSIEVSELLCWLEKMDVLGLIDYRTHKVYLRREYSIKNGSNYLEHLSHMNDSDILAAISRDFIDSKDALMFSM